MNTHPYTPAKNGENSNDKPAEPETPLTRRVRHPQDSDIKLVVKYLTKHSPVYSKLSNLREAGWNSSTGDSYFIERENNADNADDATRYKFFIMMVRVLHQLDEATQAITTAGTPPTPLTVLDLCLAPGGFTKGTLELRPGSIVKGITLPTAEGGHKVILNLRHNHDIRIVFNDITMFSNEFGVPAKDIPDSHPDKAKFVDLRPFGFLRFDLVFADAQILRTQTRGEHRGQAVERVRLRAAQILLALGRIKNGGTMITLLNHMETPQCIDIMRDFESVSEVTVWKPMRFWGVKSTFYLVAKNVQSCGEKATALVEKYRRLWKGATFDGKVPVWSDEEVASMLEEYGERLVELGTPTWRIQSEALEKSVFIAGDRQKENRPKRSGMDTE